MAIKVHKEKGKENAKKVGNELFGGRNNRRADKMAGDDTRELGECKERKKHNGQKQRQKREEMVVKSRGIFQN